MVKVCVIVGLLLLCSSAAFARQQAQVKLTLTVTDQTEAPIPGAHVTATNDQTGEQSNAKTDRLGAASILLNKGDYSLKAQAPGFFWWELRHLGVRADTTSQATLTAAQQVCDPCEEAGPVIEFDHQYIEAEIPLLPIDLLPLPSQRIRRRTLLF